MNPGCIIYRGPFSICHKEYGPWVHILFSVSYKLLVICVSTVDIVHILSDTAITIKSICLHFSGNIAHKCRCPDPCFSGPSSLEDTSSRSLLMCVLRRTLLWCISSADVYDHVFANWRLELRLHTVQLPAWTVSSARGQWRCPLSVQRHRHRWVFGDSVTLMQYTCYCHIARLEKTYSSLNPAQADRRHQILGLFRQVCRMTREDFVGQTFGQEAKDSEREKCHRWDGVATCPVHPLLAGESKWHSAPRIGHCPREQW